MTNQLRKAGANWVDGDRFFDRADELAALTDRVGHGTHTLLTAQRRMGKTSLVRELLRRLDGDGAVTTVFVDLEGANDAADAVAEIAIQAKPVQSAWERIGDAFANHLREVRDHVDEVGLADLRVKLRAGIDAGSWQRSGDRVFEALAANDEPVVLAIDELPILVNRLLKPESTDRSRGGLPGWRTDRSLTGRAAGLASSVGVPASAGRCRGRAGARSRRSASLGGAEGAVARVREACAGMLARASERGRRCERASGRERYRP